MDEGGYVRTAATIEWHPDVSAEFLRPGIGARLWYERGDGTLSFQRMEARVVGRQLLGPLVVVGRDEVGTVLGNRPPAQQLFELGAQQNLPGYRDKEFAGTRAAVLRGQVQYNTGYLQQPIRFRRIFLPAVSPSVSVGLQGGWTELPNIAARAAALRLGTVRDSTGALSAVSRATDGGRASVSAGMRFFGGGLFVGATRPVDHVAPWKFVVSFGQPW